MSSWCHGCGGVKLSQSLPSRCFRVQRCITYAVKKESLTKLRNNKNEAVCECRNVKSYKEAEVFSLYDEVSMIERRTRWLQVLLSPLVGGSFCLYWSFS
jgi:hypothetical protein